MTDPTSHTGPSRAQRAWELNDGSSLPVWFLDVDGVLNSLPRAKPHHMARYGHYDFVHVVSDGESYPISYRPTLVDFVNRVHREGLAEVVWLTTWVEDAVRVLAPALGLDEFPVVTNMEGSDYSYMPTWWKLRRVYEFLGDNDAPRRPVVWTDDDLNRSRRHDFRMEYDEDGGWSCVVTPMESPGLLPEHEAKILAFLEHHKSLRA